jgi:hypothetical protein
MDRNADGLKLSLLAATKILTPIGYAYEMDRNADGLMHINEIIR